MSIALGLAAGVWQFRSSLSSAGFTFDATGIAPGEDGWSVPGVLAGHGHRTAITLGATVTPGDGSTLAVHATAEFDRRDLGITAPRFLLGTRVRITVDAVFAAPA
ncbi:MAG TPA: YceI family protein [Jatrophihabitans sp.]|uniref:YceI family protein n=1 Tax=Jatrophihabitans sp. TaxID=1932789 RepID=UPI002E00670F|nr:YceI family protein [Jatrophihabitans sp.]